MYIGKVWGVEGGVGGEGTWYRLKGVVTHFKKKKKT